MKPILYLLILTSAVSSGQSPKVIAHRGGSSMSPENTISAFNKAVEVNADYYELDVQISSDDSLVIMHDATVDRTTNGTGAIKSMTYAQLRTLDAGSWFKPEFTGEKVPTLREALSVAKNTPKNIGIVVELKSGETTLASRTVEVIKDMGLQNRVIVSSFNFTQISQVKALDPSIPVQLFEAITNANIDQVAAINGEWVGSGGNVTQAIISYAHSKGIKFNAWTINTASQMQSLIALGVDAITTDYPVTMIKLLDSTEPTDVVLSSATCVSTSVTLTWEAAQDNESGVTGYEIFRDTSPNASTLLTSVGAITQYTDQTNTGSQTFYYRIKAKNLAGLRSVNYSNELSITTSEVLTDLVINYITSKTDPVSVVLELSTFLNKSSAENSANYLINNGITVESAELALDQKSVILKTSPLSDQSYILTVSGVQDNSLTPKTIVPVNAIFTHQGSFDNMVAMYKLDNLVPGDPEMLVVDASNNVNNGSAINGPFLAPGLLGNALGFDGIDDYVQFPSSTSFDIPGSEVSISLWAKLDYLPDALIAPYGPLFDSETDQYVMYEDKGNLELRFKVVTTAGAERPGIPNDDLVTGEWIYLVGVYDGISAKIYLNGILKDTHPLTGTVNSGQEATLGKSGVSFFSGNIDQVEILSKALTEAEIQEKFNLKSIPVSTYPISVIEKPSQNGVTIYPNPCNSQFTLELNSNPDQNADVELINAQGRIVFADKVLNTKKKTILLPSNVKGVFIIKVSAVSGIYKDQIIIL